VVPEEVHASSADSPKALDMALPPPDGRAMPAGAPFNAAMAKARELITKLRYEADQSALDEEALARARELDTDEYAARHATRPDSPDPSPKPPGDTA
jgi:hypothetical protein